MNSTRTVIKFHEPRFTGLKPLGDRLIVIQKRWDGELGLKKKTNAPITFSISIYVLLLSGVVSSLLSKRC